MEPVKLQLSKSNQRKMKIASLSSDLINAIKCCNELRLKQSLTLDLVNSVEFLIKDSYGIEKPLFAKHILVEAFNLNEEEQKVVTEQIEFLYENNHVKKFGTARRLLNKAIKLLLKKNLLRVL
jgi:hypothetical protein